MRSVLRVVPNDRARRDRVLANLRAAIQTSERIFLDRRPEGPYTGRVDEFQYLFEGEDDLLHLIIERRDGGRLQPDDTKAIARFLLPGVPDAMVWLRPGARAHHYYLGHDLLLGSE